MVPPDSAVSFQPVPFDACVMRIRPRRGRDSDNVQRGAEEYKKGQGVGGEMGEETNSDKLHCIHSKPSPHFRINEEEDTLLLENKNKRDMLTIEWDRD